MIFLGVARLERPPGKFSYARSDGSAWALALKDVVDRTTDLDMAYNLNDCVGRAG